MAAMEGAHQVLRLLLAAGADPYLKTGDGKTPLDVATFGAAQIIRRHLATHKRDRAKRLPGLPGAGGKPATN